MSTSVDTSSIGGQRSPSHLGHSGHSNLNTRAGHLSPTGLTAVLPGLDAAGHPRASSSLATHVPPHSPLGSRPASRISQHDPHITAATAPPTPPHPQHVWHPPPPPPKASSAALAAWAPHTSRANGLSSSGVAGLHAHMLGEQHRGIVTGSATAAVTGSTVAGLRARDADRAISPALSQPMAATMSGSGSTVIEAMFDQFLAESLAFAALKKPKYDPSTEVIPECSTRSHTPESSDDGSDDVDEDELATVLVEATRNGAPKPPPLTLPPRAGSLGASNLGMSANGLSPNGRAVLGARMASNLAPGAGTATSPSYAGPDSPRVSEQDPEAVSLVAAGGVTAGGVGGINSPTGGATPGSHPAPGSRTSNSGSASAGPSKNAYPSHPGLAQRNPPPVNFLRPSSVPSFGFRMPISSPVGRHAGTQMALVHAHARQSSAMSAMGAMSPLRATVMTPLSNLAVDLPKELRVGSVNIIGRNWDVTADPDIQTRPHTAAAACALDVTRRAIANIANAAALPQQPAPSEVAFLPLGSPRAPSWLSTQGEVTTFRLSSPVSRARHKPQWRRSEGDKETGMPQGYPDLAMRNRPPEALVAYVQDVARAALEGAVVRDRLDAQLAAGDALLRPSTAQNGGSEVGRLLRRHAEGATELNLSHAVSSLPQVIALVEGLPGLIGVQRLILGYNDMSDMAFELLAVVLSTPACGTVFALDVHHNRLTAVTVDRLLPLMQEEMAKAVVGGKRGPSAISTRALLSELVLAGNAIGDAGVELLCEALEEKCLLLKLDISRCSFGERGAAALGKMIAENRRLTSLDVSWNNLGLRGSRHMAAGISDASSLTHLLMAWTGINDAGAANVGKSLASNMTLKVVDLSGCGVSADACVVLTAALGDNSTLESLVLRNNPLGLMGAKRLLAVLHAGVIQTLDILGCSFQPINSLSGTFDPRNPDGQYILDLSQAAHRQISFELLQLAAEQGISCWVNATIADKPFRLVGPSKLQIPVKGLLELGFRSSRPVLLNDAPLTDTQLDQVWTSIVQSSVTSTAAAAAASAHSTAQAPSPAPGIAGPLRAVQKSAAVDNGGSSTPSRANSLSPVSPTGSSDGSRATTSPIRIQAINRGLISAANSRPCTAGGAVSPRDTTAIKGVTDDWKLGLLTTIASDSYLECRQLKHILGTFDSRDGKIEAIIKAFGILSDPENMTSVIYPILDATQRAAVDDRIGALKHFTPANPTGRWNLILSHQAQYLVARRMVTMYCQQFDAKQSVPPFRMCFVSCALDGKAIDAKDPRRIIIPHEGILSIVFSDLRPIPAIAENLNAAQFAALAWMMTSQAKLEGTTLLRVVDHPAMEHATNLAEAHHCWMQLSKRPSISGESITPFAVAALAQLTAGNGRYSPSPLRANGAPSSPQSPSGPRSSKGDSSSGGPPPIAPRSVTPVRLSRSNTGMLASQGSGGITRSGSITHGGSAAATPSPQPVILPGRTVGKMQLVVRDIKGFSDAVSVLAVHHYIECDQLIYLASLLPDSADDERVDLCTSCWARCTDRVDHWTDVMRSLSKPLQVRLAQRLGYYNVFNPVRPALHYRLRMFRPDEHEIAWQLYNRAIKVPHDCFLNFAVDGEVKRINEGAGLWTVMTGSVASGSTPTVTLEFDFDWPEDSTVALLSGLSAKVMEEWCRLQSPSTPSDRYGSSPNLPPDRLSVGGMDNPALWGVASLVSGGGSGDFSSPHPSHRHQEQQGF